MLQNYCWNIWIVSYNNNFRVSTICTNDSVQFIMATLRSAGGPSCKITTITRTMLRPLAIKWLSAVSPFECWKRDINSSSSIESRKIMKLHLTQAEVKDHACASHVFTSHHVNQCGSLPCLFQFYSPFPLIPFASYVASIFSFPLCLFLQGP